MASDLGEAVKRLGPTRIYIVSVIVGGVGDDLHLLVRYRLIIGERQRSNIKRRIPGPHVSSGTSSGLLSQAKENWQAFRR